MIKSKEKEAPPIILVVDDDRVTLMTLEAKLKKQGYKVLVAENGQAASEVIERMHDVIDAILLDRMMPDMDGIEIVHWLHSQPELTKIPIIMQTGYDKPHQIKEGIDSGIFYYLTKPMNDEVLKSVVLSAVRESKQQRILNNELKSHRKSFHMMSRGLFYVKTMKDAENISCFVANCFPHPERVLSGIAELVINAIEHGNLGISYDEKTKLVKEGRWHQEIDKKLALPENKNKLVEIFFSHEGDSYSIRISDQGKGFNYKRFLQVDPSRANDSHGRGVARANMTFSRIEYNKKGNQVTAIFDNSDETSIKW